MQANNFSPINSTFSSVHPTPTKRASIAFEPYALHLISSIIKDLQFLRQQGYISQVVLEEIVSRLPKPVNNPLAPSPSSSPQQKSPTTSVKSNASQIRDSTTQRPASESSHNSHQQEQQLNHLLVQGEPVEINGNQIQSSQRNYIPSQGLNPPPQQLPLTPPPLQDTVQSQNDDLELSENRSTSKPAIPSRASIYIAQSKSSTSNTGAILATRPLPLPPNAPNSSVPQPHPLPAFNNKFEEAEYERSLNQQQVVNETILPAYSLAIVEAMWDFNGDDVDDLSFVKGDIIDVVEYVNPDWWRGRHQRTNNIGIFPKIYTKTLPARNQVDQGAVNNGYYSQLLPQHSNNISAYTSQTIRAYVEQSPSLRQQQLPSTQQQNYSTYQQYTSAALNGQQSYYR